MVDHVWMPATVPLGSQAELTARHTDGDPTVSVSLETLNHYVPTALDGSDARSFGEWLIRRADAIDGRHG